MSLADPIAYNATGSDIFRHVPIVEAGGLLFFDFVSRNGLYWMVDSVESSLGEHKVYPDTLFSKRLRH